MTPKHIAIEKQMSNGGAYIRCPWCNGKVRDSGEYISGRQPGDPLCCDQFAAAIYRIITQVVDGEAKYPARVRQAVEMTERMNLAFVEAQIRKLMHAAMAGPELSKADIQGALVERILWCPYCRLGNKFGNPELCCFDLGEAVAGVLARMEIQKKLDQANRIAENADKLKECGVTVQ